MRMIEDVILLDKISKQLRTTITSPLDIRKEKSKISVELNPDERYLIELIRIYRKIFSAKVKLKSVGIEPPNVCPLCNKNS